MKAYKTALTASFLIAMVFSILMPLGLFLLLFSVFNGGFGLLVIGIVSLVVGFYGSPMLWVAYGEKKKHSAILNLIINEQILNLGEIAEQLGKSKENTEKEIHEIISKGYLTGYKLKEGNLIPNNKQATAPINKSIEKRNCPSCNGPMDFDGQNFVCPYCGNVIKK